MIKTTVIIPNYNGIEYIENCLLAVLASDVEVKVIVIDNGSTDGSKLIIKKKFPTVKLIEFRANRGFSSAVNAGIMAADTPYVFLLNDDTLIDADAIGILERDMDEYPGVFSIQARMVKMADPSVIDSAGDNYCALGWAYATGKDKEAMNYTGLRNVFSACAGAAIYRKCVFEKIGYFDEKHFAYLEDIDLGYRALLEGYQNFADMNAIVLHAGSGTSGSRYNEFKVKLSSRNNIYLIYKNMPNWQIILNLPLLTAGFMIKTVFFTRKGLGGTYAKGIMNGFRDCLGGKLKSKRVTYKHEKLSTYIAIEILLLVNVVRRFL